MPTMNISVTRALARFVQKEIESGRYASASELVRESLLMLERGQEVEAEKHTRLKAAVQAGLDDMEAGRFSSRTVQEIAQDVARRRGR